MDSSEKERTHLMVSERGKWFRVGLLFFKVKPITLGQIYELGSFVEKLDAEGLDGKRLRLYAEVFSRYDNALLMQHIYLITAFRSNWKRLLFGWYIKKRLTLEKYAEMLDFMFENLDANFFLTSIISLKRTTRMTEPRSTTARGQSSEE